MHWMRILDAELVPPLSEAAQKVLGPNCRCELNLLSGDLRVVAAVLPSPEQARAVRQAVLARAKQLRPRLNQCGVDVKTPHVTVYTSHLAAFPQDVRPFDAPSHVITFDLRLSHLFEFRDAEAKVGARADGALRVVSFALGGVSTLIRLSMAEFETLALNSLRDGVAASDLVREKYHLFPGLNWRCQGIKEQFIDWVRGIQADGRILIFDTGTHGNGAREAFRLLNERLPDSDLQADLEFEIIGIVDGDDPASVRQEDGDVSRNDRLFTTSVDYITIANVLSEDFQRLIGYKRLSAHGYLLPLRDVGIARLINDEGRVVQITASDNIANLFQAYMTNSVGGPARLARKGREALTDEVERAMVEQVMETAMNGEVQQLHDAWVIGLIPDELYTQLRDETVKRYEDEFAAYPAHVWSFEKKKVREGSESEDAIWVRG
jgi:hypothetical protein